jgi:hypothetical protein
VELFVMHIPPLCGTFWFLCSIQNSKSSEKNGCHFIRQRQMLGFAPERHYPKNGS